MFKNKLTFANGKDDRIKIMNERINLTEKHFGELCCIFNGFARKLARYRDKNDELAKAFNSYSDEENINQSLSNGMKSFSKSITFLADFLDLEVHRIELKIVNELRQYENICKNTRENLRTSAILRDKEVSRQNQLFDLKSKFAANSSAADSDLIKSKLDVSKANRQIDEIVDKFEIEKLTCMKNVMLDFIQVQIKQYSKAIELLSATYYDISNVNEKQDFQDFKKTVKMKDKVKKYYFKNDFRSQSLEHLDAVKILTPTYRNESRLSKSSKDLSSIITEDEEDENLSEAEDDKKSDTSSDSDSAVSEEIVNERKILRRIGIPTSK